MESIKPRLQNSKLRSGEVTLNFVTKSTDIASKDSEITSDLIPVVTSPVTGDYKFNLEEYEQNLKTDVLGRVVLYADVVTSTMSVFDG